MTGPNEQTVRRTYIEPRVTVHGSVQRITQIGITGKVEKHPLKPGSKLRPK